MAVAVVTDSTSDIEPQRALQLGIDVVPLFVRFGECSYRDYLDLSRSDFYQKLAAAKELPNTSQPTASMFEDAFRPHVHAGSDIVCVTISGKLSGTINAARAAAQQFPGTHIEVVDSQTVAGGLQMQVLTAHEMAKSAAGIDAILNELARQRSVQHLYACIPDLSHVVRTGRIGKAKAVLGTLMKIVPVIALREGEVVAEAQVRTMSRARETMIDLTLAAANDIPNARFLVMHTNAPQLAADMRQRLRERFAGQTPKAIALIEAGPVIATHGGPGAVGIFCAQD
ncbi:MAG: DegV family protein [Candidatus Baltobacteraceae bacterium]